MSEPERKKDLLIAIFGYSLAHTCFWAFTKFRAIPEWIFKFGCYAGLFTMLIYCLRLKLAAEDVDPESKEAYREYLKMGSCYVIILFILELPVMLASL